MKTILITLTPLLLALSATASAEPVVERPVAVTAAGLDLATSAGAAAMLARVRTAVDRACTIDPKWDRWSDDFARCRTNATGAIVARLDAPQVTALYRGQPAPERLAAAR